MIHLTNISKQHRSQILFKKASLQILPNTRIGLVGANGTGKTTIFRLINGEEEADKGEISYSKKIKLGYFSQDVGEMSGKSALSEVMLSVSDVIALGEKMKGMETAMAEPMDENALEILLNALKNFSRTLVLVSHDRHFLRCLVDRVFEIDQGKMTDYKGDYEYYLSKTERNHREI